MNAAEFRAEIQELEEMLTKFTDPAIQADILELINEMQARVKAMDNGDAREPDQDHPMRWTGPEIVCQI